MNKALSIKNWNESGNNYVLKGNSKNKWVGFQETVLKSLIDNFKDDFNIVIWTEIDSESDYYCIPYRELKSLFVENHKTTGKFRNRWTAIILNHKFLMHSNSRLAVDIEKYYAKSIAPLITIQVDDDYFIGNATAEINIRIGQSKFRKGVLKNFDSKCALTGISEASLLTASHIVPWAHKKDYRGDIGNGICLFVEYDKFFNDGYISFTDDLKTIITPAVDTLSPRLREKLNALFDSELIKPRHKPLNLDYLRYHRENIFNRFGNKEKFSE